MKPFPNSGEVLSDDLLSQSGYKRYNSQYQSADYFWQKCVRDGEGQKIYWISIGVYDFSKYKPNAPFSYYATVHMHVDGGDYEPRSVDLDVRCFSGLADIETFAATAYDLLSGVPDPINN